MKWVNGKNTNVLIWMVVITEALFFSGCAVTLTTVEHQPHVQPAVPVQWPLGTATPSEDCGVCHQAIYREYALGFGADLQFKGIVYKSAQDKLLNLPSHVSTSGTAHSLAGVDPFPIHARGMEEEGQSCDVCHFPDAFEIVDFAEVAYPNIPKPKARSKTQEAGGLTCASYHLTPDGKMRGTYDVSSPHQTVKNLKMQTSDMCAYCHSLGKRVIGKQKQTSARLVLKFVDTELNE